MTEDGSLRTQTAAAGRQVIEMRAVSRWLRKSVGRRSPAETRGSLSPPRLTACQRVMRCVVVFVLAVAVAALLDLKGLNFLENEAYKLRAEVYADTGPAEDVRQQIVVVHLSHESFPDLPGQSALRSHHAEVIDHLSRAGAKTIAVDILFDKAEPDDADLARAAESFGKVVWACRFEDEGTPDQSLALPTAELLVASPHIGHFNLRRHPGDSVVDRLQPVIDHNGRRVPSLSLMAAMLARGLEDEPIRRVPDEVEEAVRYWEAGDLRVPADDAGHLRISYLGWPGQTFAEVAYEDVYWDRVDDESFRDKIVLIGHASTFGGDHHRTPLDEMSGVEIHAHAVATLLHGRFIHQAPWWGNFLAICLLAALVCPCAGACRFQWGALATAGLLIGYLVLNSWLFVHRELLLDFAAPTTAAVLATMGLLIERGLTEEREKNRVQGLLRRYVSPQVAEHIMTDPDAYVLGGVEATATVLFSDIRGFTGISAKLDPQQIVEYLNDYLQAMTDAVFEHDGAVDKYAGDGIMALFGVPVPHADHARRAVATAIDMQAAALKLQTHWHTQGLPVADIGIGINTGEVVVGNIGSTQRMDFTVIGDPVNVAERVEGLTKPLSARILVTEATYQHVQGEVRARGPITAAVEGRDEEIAVYEILGWGVGTS